MEKPSKKEVQDLIVNLCEEHASITCDMEKLDDYLSNFLYDQLECEPVNDIGTLRRQYRIMGEYRETVANRINQAKRYLRKNSEQTMDPLFVEF